MEYKKFSPRDAKLLKDNEGKTPDELRALGLSERAYRRLLADSIAITQPDADTVIIQPVSVAQVNIHAVEPKLYVQNKRVQLHNKKTGSTVTMGYKAATLLAEKYPAEFEIV